MTLKVALRRWNLHSTLSRSFSQIRMSNMEFSDSGEVPRIDEEEWAAMEDIVKVTSRYAVMMNPKICMIAFVTAEDDNDPRGVLLKLHVTGDTGIPNFYEVLAELASEKARRIEREGMPEPMIFDPHGPSPLS